jgi:hypothetical protein
MNSQIEGQTTQWPKSKKDAMVRRQSTNNDLQNTTQKTKDRISRNPFKTEGSIIILFKCLYQARKVSGHACILGVSILHLSIILIVILESCWYCISFMHVFFRSLFVFFLLAIVLSVLLPFTDSDYPFGIFWSLYCLSFWRQTIQWPKDTNGVIRL